MLRLIPILVSVTLLFSGELFASPRLDPHLSILQQMHSGDSQTGVSKSSGLSEKKAPPVVGVFIKTQNMDALRQFFNGKQGAIHTVIGDIATAQISLEMIDDLKAVDGVSYVELSHPLSAKLQKSRSLIGADLVHSGTQDFAPYTGANVVIGIVDSGIDWRHKTFQGADGKTRLLSLWDQSLAPGLGFVPPREIANSYGLECVRLDFLLGHDSLCPSKDTIGHGTHVAGIASGSDNLHKGIAPAADIIAVKLPIAFTTGDVTPEIGEAQSFSDHIVDGVHYIFQKAAALGKPAVVNLSLGGHFGPHDSTSLFEQALSNLVAGQEGRVIVVSAGNEANISNGYLASLHAGFSLSGETRAVEWIGTHSQIHAMIMDVWQPAESQLSFGVGIDSYSQYENTGQTAPGTRTEHTTADGKLNVIIDASETANPLNGKKHVVIYVIAVGKNDGVTIALSKYHFDLIVSGNGSFDAWVAAGGVFSKRNGLFDSTGLDYNPGDSQHTVASPATASGVITVGSHASRNNFDDIKVFSGDKPDLSKSVVGKVSPFSSVGPTADPGRTGQKPEIIAPGEWIQSAMSEAAESNFKSLGLLRDGQGYVLMSGTSMAAPHVTGAVALLLERDPTLTSEKVERLLCQSTGADTDEVTSPDNQRGYGHLNIARAMQYFPQNLVEGDFSVALGEVAEVSYEEEGGDAGGIALTRLTTSSLIGVENWKNRLDTLFSRLTSLFTKGQP